MSQAFHPLLHVSDLHVSVEGTEVVRGLNLLMIPGEVHAIMGPNGSGKSSLVNALMGHPRYIITKGTATLDGEDLLAMAPHERARKGLFLAFQYPKEISGVTLRSFLFAAYQAKNGGNTDAKRVTPMQFQKLLLEEMKALKMDPSFAERSLNKGFSGGEKKKAEILQMAILRPQLALLDETDSGLDVDALKIVAEGVNNLRNTTNYKLQTTNQSSFSALIVTHYARILEYIKPDRVHVMIEGRIIEEGGPEFAKQLEKEGYAKYGVVQKPSSLSLDIG